MFEVHPELKSIPVRREQIVAIIESNNTPMVAAQDHQTQLAKAFVIGTRNPNGLFSIFIYLHLLESNHCLIFLCNPPEFPMNAYHQSELEAIQFVESMGFMVDNLHFRNLPAEQQKALLESIPITYADLQAFAQRLEAVTSGGEDEADLDASDDEEIIDLAEVVDPAALAPMISEDALAKIIRMMSSF